MSCRLSENYVLHELAECIDLKILRDLLSLAVENTLQRIQNFAKTIKKEQH